MLKSFREQNIDVNKEVSDAIDAVVDNWVKELLTSVVSSPMSPEAKRSLWDRFKGSLANIWYGGKYNPKNPYYWKHRFGDELGATTESFDPSVFTLYEYHDLKSAVDDFESIINEQDMPAGTEKLKLVQVIKSAAEKLKRDLKNIFIKSIAEPAGEPAQVTRTSVPPAIPSVGGSSGSAADLGIDIKASVTPPPIKRGRGRPRKAPLVDPKMPVDAPGFNLGSPPSETLPVKYEVGNESKYKKWLPKESNVGRSLESLKKDNQYVDWILHPDFKKETFYDPEKGDSSVEAAAKLKIKNLEKLKDDAEKIGESQSVIDKIIEAIVKMKKFYE